MGLLTYFMFGLILAVFTVVLHAKLWPPVEECYPDNYDEDVHMSTSSYVEMLTVMFFITTLIWPFAIAFWVVFLVGYGVKYAIERWLLKIHK